MRFCSVPHRFLLSLLFLPFISGSEPSQVTVKFNHTVTLVCKSSCSTVEWTMFQKQSDLLAWCNKDLCNSTSGYNTSRSGYQEGNQTLTIDVVDFSKRGTYTCTCGTKDACDIRLSIEPLVSLKELNQFSDLEMDVHLKEQMEVLYKQHTGDARKTICQMKENEMLQCVDDYKNRVSISGTVLTLSGVTPADSGVYTVHDSKRNEKVHIYPVTVVFPVWLTLLMVLLALVLLLYVVPLVAGFWFLRKCRETRRQMLRLRWFCVKQVRDHDPEQNRRLLLALPLYTAPLLWVMYKDLKDKYSQFKEHSDCLEVYVTLKKDSEEALSMLRSEEQKQRVLFLLLNDLDERVDEFTDSRSNAAWDAVVHLNRLLQHLSNTSLGP